MIKGFKHKGLQELFERGTTRKIQKTLHARCLRRLDALKDVTRPEDMSLPGFDFHALRGGQRCTVYVNGPWWMTFEFVDGDADRVDFEHIIEEGLHGQKELDSHAPARASRGDPAGRRFAGAGHVSL